MRLLTLLLLFGISTTLRAQGRPILVELFTSEGCSSCPPADDLVRQLNGTRSSSGDLIVALSEHVTYWNSLGWQDPFSSDIATERQRLYGEHFHLDDVYTPQIVVQGTTQVLGSDRAAVLRAIGSIHHQGGSVHISSVKANGDGALVTFSVSGMNAPVAVFAAITEDEARSRVRRGENGGRTLTHVAVTRSVEKLGITGNVTEKTVQIHGIAASKRHIVLFAQAPGFGPVISVDAAAL